MYSSIQGDTPKKKRQTTGPTPKAVRSAKLLVDSTIPIARSSFDAKILGAATVPEETPVVCEVVSSPVVVLAPRECFDHDTGHDHQENSGRLSVLCGPTGALRRDEFEEGGPHALTWRYDAPSAVLADLIRVHDFDYVLDVQRKCRDLQSRIDREAYRSCSGCTSAAVPLPTPSSQCNKENMIAASEGSCVAVFDADTKICAASWTAAVKASGAAIAAVDMVMEGGRGGSNVAMVLGRPPGHHGGPRGAVCDTSSCHSMSDCSNGFCLFNHVAVAASYARYRHGREGIKVAIVDFDIHHGNGTEDIIRNLEPRRVPLPLPPSWPKTFQECYKPWYDETDGEHVFFGSINLVAEGFYPGTGQQSHEETKDTTSATTVPLPPEPRPTLDPKAVKPTIVNVQLDPVGPFDQRARARQTLTQRLNCGKIASQQFRSRVETELLRRLDEFAPDLLFISAGFDGHYDDFYHYLSETDYGWLTDRLVEIMAPRGGKIVSILEGGYSLKPAITPKADKKTKPPMRTRKRQQNTGEDAPTAAAAPDTYNLEVQSGLLVSDGGLVKGVVAMPEHCAEHDHPDV
eukprot:CAMPEP_0185787516 /NCGR_PEP_ID=MMETSP1174-20130828/141128_1 /TAXON_ID=35687 /ORGANISM="Dictyocha speculum, Strain CCMP1381" /LENGTH=572 /DNA_ID=CAMNT_0028480721 /DNA_START=202 /DNA_END=1921 /DNA_ORIENTATION=+